MISTIAKKLVGNKWRFLFFLVVVTLVSSMGLSGIKLDNSLEGWFLKNDPTLENYKAFQKLYGSDEVVSVLLIPPSGVSVFDRPFVEKVGEITGKLESGTFIKKVISITAAPYMAGTDDELILEDMVTPSVYALPDDSEFSRVVEERIKSQAIWDRLLFDKERNSVMFFIEPYSYETEEMDKVRPELLGFVKDCFKGQTCHMAGMGVTYDELNRISMNDSVLFTSIAYVILIFILYLFFRNIGILIASTLSIIITVVLFMGIFAFFGKGINMMSAVLPTLIIILSLADNVHIFLQYEKTPPGKDRLVRTLSHVLLPCFFTSVTTSIGFASLASSPIAILKDFGIFVAIGIGCAFCVSAIVCTTVLSYYEKGQDTEPFYHEKDRTDRLIEKITGTIMNHHAFIMVAGVVLIAVGGAGISKLVIDTYSIEFLLDRNPVKKDSLLMEERFGFYLPLEIRIKPQGVESVQDPDFLKKVDMLEKEFEHLEGFEISTTLCDVVKQLNKVLTDNKEESYRIPDTIKAVAQELLLYELDSDNDLDYFTNYEYSEIRFTVKVPMVSAKSLRRLMERADEVVARVMKEDVTVIYGGYIPLYVKLLEYITESQVKSFLIAFVCIFMAMGILFRSARVIAIGIIPNILPVFLTLGIMGFMKINLDIATVTIAVIVIGVAVDDTIHFIFNYMKHIDAGMPVEEAIRLTLLTSGKAIIVTSVMLIAGYSVLVFASIKSVIFFGFLIAVTMFSAVICDLLLLPATLMVFGNRRQFKNLVMHFTQVQKKFGTD